MDINRPSLYGAFGDKEHLYAASVDRYVATIGQSYFAPLAQGTPLAAGLMGFFDAVIDVVTGRHGPLGCVVACTLPAEAGTSAAARDQLARVLAQLDDALRARLRAAQAAGEIARGRDVRALAEVATSGMLSISIRARAGASRRELRRLARSFVELITTPSA
ncbi:MAG: TetR family transcriptional regulator C-terminal domain-containing protein [Myxococcota bacterium]|jgi:AcrR family transcriptional regulator|nr:TetR family transcriptional regulator C-terminal domain-containing protein [Myxococcota bacterium]